MSKYIDLKNQRFGSLVAKEFIGGPYGEWICECDCGNTYTTRGKYLRNGYKIHCNKCNQTPHTNVFKDLTGQKFNEWKVIKYLGNNKWECECSCGRTRQVISGSTLKNKETKMCKLCINDSKLPDLRYDMTNMKVGSVSVIRYISSGTWECKCSCGKIINVKGFNLRKAIEENKGYKCEDCSAKDRLDDITGKTFGLWHVDKYIGNGIYQCTCGCNNHTVRNIIGKSLKNGLSTSCGCAIGEKMRNTKIERYGDITVNTRSIRSEQQIKLSSTSEALEAFIVEELDSKATLHKLSLALGISECAVGRKIHKFGLENYIDYSPLYSKLETEIREFTASLGVCNMEYNNRIILEGKELDIYLPDHNLAIEFNGTYWHSSIFKDRLYHQKKSLACEEKGIRLIHIFEYEWINEEKQEKLKRLLKNIISTNKNRIYARDTQVANISVSEAREFCEKYHLQGYVNSEINIGIKYNNELIGVMSFGNPRFNRDYEYELLRLCYKSDIGVIGGTEKMFEYFKKKFNATSVISYCDISKFEGKVYENIGFKLDHISNPNYVWVDTATNETLSRYQTQKQTLIRDGLGTPDQTEDEIMENIGYLKIYDAGNKVFIYKHNN